MSNEKLGTVIKLAHNLIKIEVHKLRKIPLLTSYKDDVIEAIGELFRFYNIEIGNYIEDIYKLEEKKFNSDNDYFNNMPFTCTTNHYKTIEYSADVYIKLMNFASNDIYSVCLHGGNNEELKGYKLEEKFFKLCSRFEVESDLPSGKLDELARDIYSSKNEYYTSIREIGNFPGYKWLEKKKSDEIKYGITFGVNDRRNIKTYIEKEKMKKTKDFIENNNIDEDFEKILGLRNKRSSEEHLQAWSNKHKRESIERLIVKAAHFDKKSNKFNSVGVSVLSSLISIVVSYTTKSNIVKSDDLSSEISNENLLKLLGFFKELGLNGVISESGEYFQLSGEPQKYITTEGDVVFGKMDWANSSLTNLTIEIGLKAKWNKDDNKILEDLLSVFDFDVSRLSYENNNPIIKL